MKKVKFLVVIMSIMIMLTVSNVKALSYKKTYQLLETEVITISPDDMKVKQEQEEKERKITIYVAMGVSIVSFIIFIGTTVAIVKQKKGQK